MRVRIDAEDGAEPEGERDAYAGDLAQCRRDEHHPLEHHEDADVPEHGAGEDAGDHRLAPEVAAGPEVREAAHRGAPLPMTIAVASPTLATRTSRP